MNIEELRNYCLSKPGVEETFPFDEHTMVFKVMDKMYALSGLNDVDVRVNLKCDPELAISLREKFDCVIPGYHMNKKHWNTVIVDGSVPVSTIKEWIDHSYDLIVGSLTKKKKEELKKMQ